MVDFLTKNFRSAGKFLAALRLSDPEWWVYRGIDTKPDRNWQRGWYFRGQSSLKNWLLLPTAWRMPKDGKPDPLKIVKQHLFIHSTFRHVASSILEEKQIFSSFPLPPHLLSGEEEKTYKKRLSETILQAMAEILLVEEFIDLADELGHKTPQSERWKKKVSEFVPDYIDRFFANNLDDLWMPPIIALAQHHNIQTRLLDWTKNPIAAAFFAASEVENSEAKDYIVVYALHNNMFNDHIKKFEVARAENDYLRAQAGIFTLDSMGEKLYIKNGQYPSLEDSIKLIPGVPHPNVQPKKFTLPVSESPELLRLLWLERVTKAHLMPTLDNVAEAVKTKMRYIGKTNETYFV